MLAREAVFSRCLPTRDLGPALSWIPEGVPVPRGPAPCGPDPLLPLSSSGEGLPGALVESR